MIYFNLINFKGVPVSFNFGKFLEDFSDFSSDEISLKMKLLRVITRIAQFIFQDNYDFEYNVKAILNKQKKFVICCDVPLKNRDRINAIYRDYECLFVRNNRLSKLEVYLKQAEVDLSECKLVSFSQFRAKFQRKYALKLKLKFEIFNSQLLKDVLPFVVRKQIFVAEEFLDSLSAKLSSRDQLQLNMRLPESSLSIGEVENVRRNLQIFRASKIWESNTAAPIYEKKKVIILGRDESSFLNAAFYRWFNKSDAIIKAAATEYPDATLYYWRGSDSSKIADTYCRYCRRNHIDFVELENAREALNLIGSVDHIYTDTSSMGFLGVLLEKNISVFGSTFYAGVGATGNYYQGEALGEPISVESAFNAYFLKNKTYFHPVSARPIDFSSMISFLVLQKIQLKDFFEAKDSNCNLDALSTIEGSFSAAFDAAIYIRQTGEIAKADKEKISDYISDESQIQDCAQIIALLISTANYDALAAYCESLINLVDFEKETVERQRFFYANIFNQLVIALKRSNGRVISGLPRVLPAIVDADLNAKIVQDLIIQLAKCYSFNIQYIELEELVASMLEKKDLPIVFIKMLCTVLNTRGGRNERDHSIKPRLLFACANRLEKDLNREFKGYRNNQLNRIVRSITLGNVEEVVSDYQKLADGLPGRNIVGALKSPLSVIFLVQRYKDLATMYEFFLKQREYTLAKDFIDRVSFIKTRKHVRLWLHYYSGLGDNEKVFQIYDRLSKTDKLSVSNLGLYGRALRNTYQYELAIAALSTRLELCETAEQRVTAKNSLDIIRFLKSSSEILNSHPQPRHPKGVVFIASQNCYNTLAMLVPSFLQLKKMGYAVINLTEGLVETQPTGIEYLDKHADSLPASLFALENKFDWNIDWPNRVVECNGINYYQGFYEQLSASHRKYFIDINDWQINKTLVAQLRRSDASLNICENIYKEIVIEHDFPVTFVSGNTQVTPFSIVRDFCRDKDHSKLSFVNVNIGYENYYSNLSSKYANTMCVTDMTLHKTIRAPFFARADQFEEWYSNNQGEDFYRDKAKSLINMNRSSAQNNSVEPELLKYFEKIKSEGKKIVCALGRIPVDFGVPFEGGAGHKDMADWLNHTIEIVNSLDDVVLLIKPHPHELRPEIALDLVDGLVDLIKTDLGSNIRILGHREINAHALAPYLDLAVLWSGSSSLELTALGVPVMTCSYFGNYDYPVDLNRPESREHYARSLLEMNFEKPNNELKEQAAFLMCYMGTDEISIPNQYSLRGVTNDRVGVPRWNMKRVNKLIKHGDPAMTLAANRIVEKTEKLYFSEC